LPLLAGHTANIQQVYFYAKDNMLCKFSCLIILAGQFTSCKLLNNCKARKIFQAQYGTVETEKHKQTVGIINITEGLSTLCVSMCLTLLYWFANFFLKLGFFSGFSVNIINLAGEAFIIKGTVIISPKEGCAQRTGA
jgi:hypothetical protein